ncbi:hypothetical protein LSUE1_G004776 [Lachnellula suecica]|uniref:Uncharacterized protein n=1 Tax=Lachnellula suecica TaxID=602035 RepID=A0A8T9CA71_9HELO|nr:hypothetical protein LSUE1_G004776 [Lachnellula suecica]
MMMNPGNWERAPMGYSTVETLLEDVSKQMSLSNLSRYSRASNGQRAGQTGGSMRIVKPNSASNSPRGSMGLSRRRTVMTDTPQRRRMAMMDQNAAASPAGFVSNDGLQVPTRSNRPVSWHPSTHQVPQQLYQPSYPHPAFDYNNQYQFMSFPPTPAVFSGYTSPTSTFSPVPYSTYEQLQQYPFQDTSTSHQSNSTYAFSQPAMMEQQAQHYDAAPTQSVNQALYSNFDWSNFATNGFENSTAPPTPDNYLPIQHPETMFPAEESIPFHPLSDTESIGEDLIGVGLYDTPEAAKSPSSDPQLDNYRSLMMSQLMGSAYRRPEPAGKGLKLEESYVPPAENESDDEEDDDDEQDGEGEDDDEIIEEKVKSNTTYPVQGVQQFDGNGWV